MVVGVFIMGAVGVLGTLVLLNDVFGSEQYDPKTTALVQIAVGLADPEAVLSSVHQKHKDSMTQLSDNGGPAGKFTSSLHGGGPPVYDNFGGESPWVQVFDHEGWSLTGGTAQRGVKDTRNGATGTQETYQGQGSVFQTKIPTGGIIEYIKVTAAAEDPICISYITTTSFETDLRTWNADMAMLCDKPWFPSSRKFAKTEYTPVCTWLSNNPEKWPKTRAGFSVKLTDFYAPEKEQMEIMSKQFERNISTLCTAPGRQQFWKKTLENSCTPFYPADIVKNPDTGEDADFNLVMLSHRQNCLDSGEPDNGVYLASIDGKHLADPNAPYQPPPGEDAVKLPTPEELSTMNLQSSLNLGSLGRRAAPTPMPVAPQAVEKVVEKEIVVDVEEEGGAHAVVHAHMTYHEQTVVLPHDKCHHELVVSKLSSHSAKMVCESPSSWGPDFISMEDGYYCDMCEHTLWKLCLTRFDLNCWDMHKMELRMTRRTIAARSEAGSLRKKVHKRVEYWD